MEKPEDYPVVQLSFFVESPTPFLDVFFERIAELNYPKNMIHVTAHVGVSVMLIAPLFCFTNFVHLSNPSYF
ncbi:hypothetical protein FGIG_12446 [Fasciola gigantica]|uniref:Uncharacterized protein n=1 Tax=Fasciola gigantica TaxID=46835 RepID=A0A504YP10_FASGI|nr:hypothetical protein FGIG_12446 [Fasciola gigantica]